MSAHPSQAGTSSVSVAQGQNGYIFPRSGWLMNSNTNSESPWARKIILSLDGGGVRGYSSLLILQRLMDKVKTIEENQPLGQRPCKSSADYCWKQEPRIDDPSIPAHNYDGIFKPHQYIDYFAGTSTGGLSAILLGRFQTTVREAIDQYDVIGRDVFGHKRYATWKGRLLNRYSAKRMEEALQEITVDLGSDRSRPTNDMTFRRQTTLLADGRHAKKSSTPNKSGKQRIKYKADTVALRNSNVNTARTFVVAHGPWEDNPHQHPLLFRSYDHAAPNIASMTDAQTRHCKPWAASDLPLWKIGRATSAAPTYFAPAEIGGQKIQDGAVGDANNPIILAYEEVKQVHPKHEPIVIISIGTGMQQPSQNEDTSSALLPFEEHIRDALNTMQGFQKQVLNSEAKHKAFSHRVNGSDQSINKGLRAKGKPKLLYWRFNVPSEMELTKIKLGQWDGENGAETKHTMSEATDEYLRQADQELQRCAEKLVEIRRERQKTERWESFALNLVYSCPEGQQDDGDGNECSRLLFPSRWKLRQHATRAHGFVWQVPCKDASGTPVAGSEWACNWGHCGDEQVTIFGDSAAYVAHLQATHRMSTATATSRMWIEQWLDRGRTVKPPLSPKNTNQNPR